jgi:hypothetical protein
MLTVLGCIDGRLYLLRNYSLVHTMVGVVGKDGHRARPAILWEIVEGTKLVPESVPNCSYAAVYPSPHGELATPSVACATAIIHGVRAARIVMQRNRLR